jgi:hypothetical protein
MVFDESFFLKDEKMAGVGYPRDIIQHNLLTRIVNFQLKFDAGAMRGGVMYALTGSNYFLVGTLALYRRDYWLEIIDEHPCTPYGEDYFTGSIALFQGYRLAFDMRSCAKTFSPPVITGLCSNYGREQGYGAATLFKQRAMRWNCTGMRNVPFNLANMCYYSAPSFMKGLWFRAFMIRSVCKKFLYLISPFFILAAIHLRGLPVTIGVFVCFYLEKLVRNMAVNYILWYDSPEHQASLFTMLCTPAVDMLLIVFITIGTYKCLVFDIWHSDYRWRIGAWKKYLHLSPLPKVKSFTSGSTRDPSTGSSASSSDKPRHGISWENNTSSRPMPPAEQLLSQKGLSNT